MTPISRSDWVDHAALLARQFIPKEYESRRRKKGRGIEHAKWMLKEIAEGRITGKKAHRWLGYAQAVLVEYQVFSLNDAKEMNMKASEELDVFNANQGSLGL